MRGCRLPFGLHPRHLHLGNQHLPRYFSHRVWSSGCSRNECIGWTGLSRTVATSLLVTNPRTPASCVLGLFRDSLAPRGSAIASMPCSSICLLDTLGSRAPQGLGRLYVLPRFTGKADMPLTVVLQPAIHCDVAAVNSRARTCDKILSSARCWDCPHRGLPASPHARDRSASRWSLNCQR